MADRSVTVALIAKAANYISEMRSSARATASVTDELKDASRAGRDFGTTTAVASAKAAAGMKVAAGAADHLADELGDAGRAARRLDARILESKQVISSYARQISQTTDEVERNNIWKALAREQGKMRKDIKVRDLLPDKAELVKGGHSAGMDIGAGVQGGVSSSLRSLGPVASSFAIGIGLQVATVAGPFITAALGGAVLAGAGLGVAGLGALLVKEDPRVKAAAGQLGRTAKEAFTAQASSMVDPVVKSIGILERQAAKVAPVVGDMFREAGPHLVVFAEGLSKMVDQLLPGVKKAIDSAGPVIDRLASELPGLGDAFSDMLGSISDASTGAADGLGDLIDVLGFFVRSAGFAIETGTNMYSILRGVATLDFDSVKDTVTGTHSSMRVLKTDTELAGIAARTTAEDLKVFADAVADTKRELIGAENSQIAFEQAIDDAGAAAKEGARGIDVNTAAGRSNKTALLNLAGATAEYVRSLRAQQAPTDQVTAANERGRRKFLETAAAMKVPKAQARELAAALFGIPTTRSTKVTVDTSKASSAVNAINAKIRALRGKHIQITLDAVLGNSNISLGNLLHHRWGGIDYHMADGGIAAANGLLQAGVAKSPTVLFGERETGAEAFIPKNGDPRRNMAILSEAASWMGAQVTSQRQYAPATRTGPARGGGTAALALSVSAAPGSNRELVSALVSALRFEVKQVGSVTRLLEQPA